jgi:hypothetical protein
MNNKKLYMARVNLAGLYSTKPIAVFKEPDDDWYASKDGNLVLDLNQLNDRPECIDFFSENKKDVEIWIAGASAVMRAIHSWSELPTVANPELEPKKKKKAKK